MKADSPQHVDRFAHLQAIIDGLSEFDQGIVLLRLAAKLNNGKEHFDHGPIGYSWLCHRCALEGAGGLNGWVGALRTLAAAAKINE